MYFTYIVISFFVPQEKIYIKMYLKYILFCAKYPDSTRTVLSVNEYTPFKK